MAYWGDTDPIWLSLSAPQKAAAMALLEANNANPNDATNVLGAMINRAQAEGVDLGEHVSGKIYQPTIESTQQDRLPEMLQHPAFQHLTDLAQRRMSGETPDWVQGATHFLAPEQTMLSLEAKEPNKYRSWRGWTGYDDESGSYRGVVMRDDSHAFLIPGSGGKEGVPPSTPETPLVASAKPADATSGPSPAAKENNAMFDISTLMKNFGASLSGKAIPDLEDPETAKSGSGSTLFGGMDLATGAMKTAAGGEQQEPQMVQQKKPFDMAQLQKILMNAGRMGTFRPRPGPGQGNGGMA